MGKELIILENLEIGKSDNPFAYLNFHRDLDQNREHVLKASMSMLLVPHQLTGSVDERLHPLIINTYEKSEDYESDGTSILGSKRGDLYSFDFNGDCIQHSYSRESEALESYKNRHSVYLGNLLNHSATFTEALKRFEKEIKRDSVVDDPRYKFISRVKRIESLIR
jgi:hypothetical protein